MIFEFNPLESVFLAQTVQVTGPLEQVLMFARSVGFVQGNAHAGTLYLEQRIARFYYPQIPVPVVAHAVIKSAHSGCFTTHPRHLIEAKPNNTTAQGFLLERLLETKPSNLRLSLDTGTLEWRAAAWLLLLRM